MKNKIINSEKQIGASTNTTMASMIFRSKKKRRPNSIVLSSKIFSSLYFYTISNLEIYYGINKVE